MFNFLCKLKIITPGYQQWYFNKVINKNIVINRANKNCSDPNFRNKEIYKNKEVYNLFLTEGL